MHQLKNRGLFLYMCFLIHMNAIYLILSLTSKKYISMTLWLLLRSLLWLSHNIFHGIYPLYFTYPTPLEIIIGAAFNSLFCSEYPYNKCPPVNQWEPTMPSMYLLAQIPYNHCNIHFLIFPNLSNGIYHFIVSKSSIFLY